MPDGETGVRSNWTRWQSAVFQDHVLLETGPGARDAYRPRARFRPNFRPVWRKIDTKWGSEADLSVYPDVSGLSCSPSNSNARCWTGVGLAVQFPVVLVWGRSAGRSSLPAPDTARLCPRRRGSRRRAPPRSTVDGDRSGGAFGRGAPTRRGRPRSIPDHDDPMNMTGRCAPYLTFPHGGKGLSFPLWGRAGHGDEVFCVSRHGLVRRGGVRGWGLPLSEL